MTDKRTPGPDEYDMNAREAAAVGSGILRRVNDRLTDERLQQLVHDDMVCTNANERSMAAELITARTRIDALEAERDQLRRGAEQLGRTVDRQCRDALDATGLHHLIAEDGDGDWGVVWERLAEMGADLRTARARITELEAERDRRCGRDAQLTEEQQRMLELGLDPLADVLEASQRPQLDSGATVAVPDDPIAASLWHQLQAARDRELDLVMRAEKAEALASQRPPLGYVVRADGEIIHDC